jgi:hypothetical protein
MFPERGRGTDVQAKKIPKKTSPWDIIERTYSPSAEADWKLILPQLTKHGEEIKGNARQKLGLLDPTCLRRFL